MAHVSFRRDLEIYMTGKKRALILCAVFAIGTICLMLADSGSLQTIQTDKITPDSMCAGAINDLVFCTENDKISFAPNVPVILSFSIKNSGVQERAVSIQD